MTPAPEYNLVNITRESSIARLTLNSDATRNALSILMMEEMISALDQLANDNEINIVILASSGNVFCAGHDLKELTAHRSDDDGGKAFFRRTMKLCSTLMQNIVRHPCPIIAEVQGTATAAGLQLVGSCDLAMASDEAKFCTPGVNIGLFCSTPMIALSRNVPRKKSMEMLLTGELIDAWTGKEYGIVNRVVPAQYLRQVTDKYAREIASKSSHTLKIGKEAFYNQLDMGLSDAYAYCAEVMTENMMSKDAEEGINAFLQKRDPVWTGNKND